MEYSAISRRYQQYIQNSRNIDTLPTAAGMTDRISNKRTEFSVGVLYKLRGKLAVREFTLLFYIGKILGTHIAG
jgi:hypothetical protein